MILITLHNLFTFIVFRAFGTMARAQMPDDPFSELKKSIDELERYNKEQSSVSSPEWLTRIMILFSTIFDNLSGHYIEMTEIILPEFEDQRRNRLPNLDYVPHHATGDEKLSLYDFY
jgi:hypothetical protein